MGALSSSDLAQVLKTIYPKGVPLDEVPRKCPTMALLEKNSEWAGNGTLFPLVWGAPQGASSNIVRAITNKSPSKNSGFLVTTSDDYAVWGLTGRVIAQTRNDMGSFTRFLKTELDGAMNALKLHSFNTLFRNGGGAIGRITSTSNTATATVVLQNRFDSMYFSPGQVILSSATDGTSGSVRAGVSDGTVVGQTILSVDASTGTLVGTRHWDDAITGCAASDYLFRDGDFGVCMPGFEAWLPASAPGATSFFGVDRSVETTKLGGVRLPSTSANKPIDETLIDLLDEVSYNGGTPDVIVLHNRQWTNLEKRMASKVMYGDKTADTAVAKLGLRSITINSPNGPVDVISDSNALIDTAIALQLNTWEYGSMGEQYRMLDDDGLPYLRTALADEVEGRLVSRPGLACKAPGFNGRCTLSINGL